MSMFTYDIRTESAAAKQPVDLTRDRNPSKYGSSMDSEGKRGRDASAETVFAIKPRSALGLESIALDCSEAIDTIGAGCMTAWRASRDPARRLRLRRINRPVADQDIYIYIHIYVCMYMQDRTVDASTYAPPLIECAHIPRCTAHCYRL